MAKKILFFTVFLLVFCNCYSTRKAVREAQPYSRQINWPAAYQPEKAGFYVHNKMDINASPEVVWNILLRAETWPAWYPGAAAVQVKNTPEGNLSDGSVFTWKTMGLHFESTVREFEPFSRLSWESRKKSIKGYHAWLILPTENGCMLVTDESQHGWLTFFEKTFQPKKLQRLHAAWLEAIKQKAEDKN